MSLTLIGASHQTAPVEVRERLAFAPDDVAPALAELRDRTGVDEVVLVSTCNRTEIYLYPVLSDELRDRVTTFLQKKAGPLPGPVSDFLYERTDSRAARHLFRVAAGLESLVTGEAEIQGQVRSAYQAALEPERADPYSGAVLNRLFQMALSVGGRVRNETTIAEGAASVASVAVELARKIFGSLEGKRVLVLGAGEASGLVVDALGREGVEGIRVANRTYDRAEDLAQRLEGRAVHLDRIQEVLGDTDIVVSSTGSPHALITPRTLENAFPDGLSRPILFVDIAIPRDVAPEVAEDPRVFLYNVDDLRHIVDRTLEERRGVLDEADRIVEEEVDAFAGWFSSLEVVPAIRALREGGEEVREAELERLLGKLGDVDPAARDQIEAFSHRLLNKILDRPTRRLRDEGAAGRGSHALEAFGVLFGPGSASSRSGPHTDAGGGAEEADPVGRADEADEADEVDEVDEADEADEVDDT